MFQSKAEQRRIEHTIKKTSIQQLTNWLTRLQDKEPNSDLIPMIVAELAKRGV